MMNNPAKKTDEMYMHRAVRVSLWCNIVLVSLKTVALIIVNSLAIAVDLGISIAGLTVSFILYYSIRLSNRPADMVHNYGYGKVEHVCEALEGVVLIGISFAMLSQAITSFFHLKHVEMQWLGLLICCINATINFSGSVYILKMAHKSSSPAVQAEGLHYRLEGFISGIIALSFAVSMILRAKGHGMLSMYIDPIATVLVSMIVIVPSFTLARSSFFKLLDSSVEEDSQLEILKYLNMHVSNYCEFKDLRSRTAGRKKFIEFSLVLPDDVTLSKGHELSNEIENDIKKHIPNSEISIKIVPCERDCEHALAGEECPYV